MKPMSPTVSGILNQKIASKYDYTEIEITI